MPLGNLRTLQLLHAVLRTEHKRVMQPLRTCWGVTGGFGGALFRRHARSLVTSSLWCGSPTETESLIPRLQVRCQEEETYNIVAAHGYFGRLIFQLRLLSKQRAACTSCWPPGRWWAICSRPGRGQLLVQPATGLKLHHSVLDSPRPGDQHLADVLNRVAGHRGDARRNVLTTSRLIWPPAASTRRGPERHQAIGFSGL